MNNDDKHKIMQRFCGGGLSGLQNLGNTCFINSAIHSLGNTLPLTYYFLSGDYKDDINNDKIESHLVKEWERLLSGIWGSNCTVAPYSFIKTIHGLALRLGRSQFTGFGQNDTQEFIEFCIDTMHESLAKEVDIKISGKPKTDLDKMALEAMKRWKDYFKNSYSIFVELFYGQYVSKRMSLKDSSDYSLSYDPFCYLTLPIPDKDNITIYDCLKKFTTTELLTGENKWESEKEGRKIDAIKQIMFWSTPNILIMSFKRNKYNGEKITRHIDYPINNLNLEKFCVGYDKYNSKYNLYAICCHSGGSGFGHYWAYCKNKNGHWHNFNDEQVNRIMENQLVTKNAYCLFYEKIKKE